MFKLHSRLSVQLSRFEDLQANAIQAWFTIAQPIPYFFISNCTLHILALLFNDKSCVYVVLKDVRNVASNRSEVERNKERSFELRPRHESPSSLQLQCHRKLSVSFQGFLQWPDCHRRKLLNLHNLTENRIFFSGETKKGLTRRDQRASPLHSRWRGSWLFLYNKLFFFVNKNVCLFGRNWIVRQIRHWKFVIFLFFCLFTRALLAQRRRFSRSLVCMEIFIVGAKHASHSHLIVTHVNTHELHEQ